MPPDARRRARVPGAFERLQILGPFHSGTTLLFNYQRQLLRVPCRYHWAFWKHSVPPDWGWERGTYWPHGGPVPIEEIFATTLFVCMVRLPYFWLRSCCRTPYNLRFLDGGADFSARLRSRVRLHATRCASPVELWNVYYRRYLEQLPPESTYFVRLEDLVADPASVVDRLARLVPRREVADPAAVIERIRSAPSKRIAGEPCVHGREAERRYRLENVPRVIDPADLELINRQLDPALLERFGYPRVEPLARAG